MKKSKKNLSNRKLIYSLLIVVLILVVCVGFYFYRRNKENTADQQGEKDAKTTSLAPTAQEDFTDGDKRTIQETNKDKGDATVSDNQGSITKITNPSEWMTSSSHEITLYSPAQNQIVRNGDYISGESSLNIVSFRIIDDISGVISTGQLSVVKGKFSGTISFSTTASSGRLDIYGTRDDGGEFSNVEVPVRFK